MRRELSTVIQQQNEGKRIQEGFNHDTEEPRAAARQPAAAGPSPPSAPELTTMDHTHPQLKEMILEIECKNMHQRDVET